MKITKSLQYSEKINGNRITFYGNSIDEIVSDVMRIRKKNGVSSPEFNRLYNIIKGKISGSIQVDGVDSRVFKKQTLKGSKVSKSSNTRSVSINDASRAAKALIKIIPGDYVEKSEYLRRLQICSSCPLRQKNSDCLGCGGSGRAARIMMSFRSKLGLGYQLDNKVGAQFCGFCGCSLSLLLVTKVQNYKKESDIENDSRPNHCWLNRNSPNYNGK